MSVRITISFTLALLFLAAPHVAAEPVDVEIFAPITYVIGSDAGNQAAAIGYGTLHGVARGERLLVYRPIDNQLDEIGYARIDSIDAEFSVAFCYPTTVDSFLIGDLIEMRARVEWPEEGELTLWTAANAFELTELFGDTILDPDSLLRHPEGVNDREMAAELVASLEEAFEYLPDVEELQPVLAGGRFSGMTGVEAIEKTDVEDMLNFLRYARSYPAGYAGRTFTVAETYAGWIISSAPVSSWETIDAFPAMSEAEQDEFLERNREPLVEDGAANNWYLVSRDLYLQGRHELALRILDILGRAAAKYDLEGWHHYYWSAKGDIHSWASENEEAIAALANAIATAGEDSVNHSAGYHNRATVYEEMELWSDAIADFETSLRWKGALENPFANPLSASSLEGIGRCYKGMQEYERAAEYLTLSGQVYEMNPDLDALESMSRAYSSLGDVYDEMGRYGDAIDAWRKGWEASEKLGWQETMADALADMSDGHWNLGDLRDAVDKRNRALVLARELYDEEKIALIQINLAELYSALGDNDSTRISFDEALEIYERRKMSSDIGDTYRRMGNWEKQRGDVNAALRDYAYADSIYTVAGDPAALAEVRIATAEAFVEQRRYEEAIEFFRQAAANYGESADRTHQAYALERWGNALFLNADPAGAMEKYSEALSLHEELSDLEGQSNCHRYIGDLVASFDGDADRALRETRLALEIAEAMPSKYHIAEARISLGYRHSNEGNMKRAFANQEAALALFEETENADGISRAHIALGNLYEVRGQYEEGRRQFDTALRIAKEAEMESKEADAYGEIAWLLYIQGESDQARRYAEDGLAIQERLGNEWAEPTYLTTLASLADRDGELDRALELHGRAHELDLKWNNVSGQAADLNNIGQVYDAMRDWKRAAEYYEQSLAISERMRYADAAIATTGNLALCFYELGRPEDALIYVERGIVKAREADSRARLVEYGRLKGELLRKEKKFAEARRVLNDALAQAVEINKTLTLLAISSELGILAHDEGDFERAATDLRRTIDAGKRYRMPIFIAKPLLYLGRTERARGNDEAAVLAYRNAIKQLEQVGRGLDDKATRASFQRQHGEAYSELVALLHSLGQDEEAWEVLGLMKSQEMRDMGERSSEDETPEAKATLDRAEGMRSRESQLMRKLSEELGKPESEQRMELLDAWEAELDSIVFAFEDFVTALKEKQPDLYGKLEIEPVSFHQLQGSLERNEAFVEPLLLPDRLVVFVVRGGEDPLVVRETPVDAEHVKFLITEMRESLSRPDLAWEGTRAKLAMPRQGPKPPPRPTVAPERLYELLIEPILSDLHGIETLIFSPSGRLRYIPFAALYDGERYLIDRFRSCVLTKAGVLADRGSIEAGASILAFCNPDSSLAGAEREVRMLAQMWGNENITTYCGDDATKRRLRRELAGFSILHLATHGKLLNHNPQGSYLLLGGQGERRNLTFREIKLLPLTGVDLAVLSACETAVGEHGEGKEIAGLAYNFQDRGTASVIASLWAVDDDSTADLMVELYSALRTGESSRVAALHGAQRALRGSEEYSHPYYWAPFILIGSWR